MWEQDNWNSRPKESPHYGIIVCSASSVEGGRYKINILMLHENGGYSAVHFRTMSIVYGILKVALFDKFMSWKLSVLGLFIFSSP